MTAAAAPYPQPESSEDSNAPRRGLADGATEQLAVVRGAVSHWQVAHRRAVMVAEHLRHPVGVLGQRPASSVRCERTVSTRACPRDRCPVRAYERPGVRRSVSSVGVRCPAWASGVQRGRPVSVRSRVRCVRPGCGQEGGGGAGSRMAGMAGVGVVARRVHDWLVVCPGRHLAAEAGAARAGSSGGVGLDLAVVVGGGWQWRGRPRGRPG
jgi:hypothetical protein